MLQLFKDLSEGKMSVGQMQVELHSTVEVRLESREPWLAVDVNLPARLTPLAVESA